MEEWYNVEFTNEKGEVVRGRVYEGHRIINGKSSVYIDGKRRPRLVSVEKLKAVKP
jgi:hypothetical protein